MVAVTIDRGPVSPASRVEEVPQEKWRDLLRARRGFLAINLPYDCRMLLQFVEEADRVRMWESLGFNGLNDLIRRGFELEPQMVHWAIDGLKSLKPDEPISFKAAIELGQWGGDRKSEKARNQGSNTTLVNVGRGLNYTLARLDRDHPELARKVKAGELSANAAAIQAGFRKVPTPLEQLHKAWNKATAKERRQFLDEVT